MNLHTRSWVQKIPATPDEVWSFFSMPENLLKIMPPEIMLRITNESGLGSIHEGMIITCTIHPFMMIPVDWTTEITKVSKPDLFEDRQLQGPFEEWRHRHLFRQIDGGVEMTDIVGYRLPLGPLGELVDSLIVRQRLEEAFAWRARRIGEIFGLME